MSWSINKSGTVEEVVMALKEQSEYLSDQSKEEYDAALPHMIALVEQNIIGTVNLFACGHGVKDSEGNFVDRSCSVSIAR
jgi:hypothetical protein